MAGDEGDTGVPPWHVGAVEYRPSMSDGEEDMTADAGAFDDGRLYSVGEPWDHQTMALPPGDSFGLYWQGDDDNATGGGGLFLLAAICDMTTPELEGWRTGAIRCHFGQLSGDAGTLLIGAMQVDGFGWLDVCTGHTLEQGFTAATGVRGAERWGSGGAGPDEAARHGTVVGVVVNRQRLTLDPQGPTSDTIAALRYFTLSPHVTKYVGKVLAASYAGAGFTDATYTTLVLDWQARNPHTPTWAKDKALVYCRAGD